MKLIDSVSSFKLACKETKNGKEFQPLWKIVYILKYKNYLGVVYFIYIISIL